MRLVLGLVVVLALGCGGTDIEGMYQVTSHTFAEGCGTEVAATGEPYFRIEQTDFFGQDVQIPHECETTSVDTCTGFGFFALLAEEIDSGYRGTASLASGGGATCALSYYVYTATLDGDVLTFHAEQYGETVTSATCDADEATNRGTDMPCVSTETIVGTRVE